MQQVPLFFTSIFLLLRSLWAIAGLPEKTKNKDTDEKFYKLIRNFTYLSENYAKKHVRVLTYGLQIIQIVKKF